MNKSSQKKFIISVGGASSKAASTAAPSKLNSQSRPGISRKTTGSTTKGVAARGVGAHSFFLNSSGSTYSLASRPGNKVQRRSDMFNDVSNVSTNVGGSATHKNKLANAKHSLGNKFMASRESQNTLATNSQFPGNQSAMNFARGNFRPSEDKAGQSSHPHNGNMGSISYFRIESEKSSFGGRLNDSSIIGQAAGTRTRARHAAAANMSKQSATIGRHAQKLAKMGNNQFWSDLTRLATHQNKIEQIDSKIAHERGYDVSEPIEKSSIDTRQCRTPRASNMRGMGGICKNMNGVSTRDPSGSANPEHVMAGRAMSAIMYPDTDQKQGRRSHSQAERFNKASELIGSNAATFKKEPVDPASMLKPDKNFRKARDASMGNKLWKEEKDMDLLTAQDKNKHEMCKAKSHERYFQSQISTLPGPSAGLNCVKTRQQDLDKQRNDDHVQRKKGYTFDRVYSSHIQNLPGTHNSTQQTQEQIERQEQERFERKKENPQFKFNNNILYGSFMQECQRQDAGLKKSRSLSEVPRELRSYQKGFREQNQNRTPSQVSMEARSKLVYQSNFKLE